MGAADDTTGQAIVAYVILREGKGGSDDENRALIDEMRAEVSREISPIAKPRDITIVPELPKTRSGKIMRRIMRKVIAGEGDQLGDLSTLAEPSVVNVIKDKVAAMSL